MAKEDAAKQELARMVEQAMQQPGVADVMAMFDATRQANEALQQSMHSLQPQWVYQSTNTSSSS
jgi:hypothetical protein